MRQLAGVLDHVPVRVWLLLMIALVAYAPARGVLSYRVQYPAGRYGSHPDDDFGEHAPRRFALNLTILVVLVALAGFIFTPAAAAFAHSPSFWPIVMIAIGGCALFSVLKGLATGRIEPLTRGFNNEYQREAQPKRFWASMTWNGTFAAMCFFGGFMGIGQESRHALEDRCYDARREYSARESLTACNQLIGDWDRTNGNLAGLLAARGAAHYRLGETPAALADYGAALRADPKNANAYIGRGLIFLDTRKLDQAEADFSQAHILKPGEAMPLADRGMAYAWALDRPRAEQDFAAARAIDPSNLIVLHGEALLAMNAGDMNRAIDRLTRAVAISPDDRWSLSLRAAAYRQLGDDRKARVDVAAVRRLSDAAKAAGFPRN
jgi:Flp pilus assembly protein TadD